jgi:hypothetical protein
MDAKEAVAIQSLFALTFCDIVLTHLFKKKLAQESWYDVIFGLLHREAT